jgi:hypothetical protein
LRNLYDGDEWAITLAKILRQEEKNREQSSRPAKAIA